MQARSFTRRILGFTATTLMAGAFAVVHAAYPDKPVRLVIGFPPGGGGDLYGRAIGNELAKQ